MRDFQTSEAPFMPPQTTVAKVMLHVLAALVPGILAYSWFFGPGILIQLALATGFALLFESLMLRMRGRPLKPFINDYSAVVTAVLFALCIPPLAPWWIAMVGMFFAIVVAKHLYGGLGYNPLNPAMVVKTHIVANQKIMPFPGTGHVVITIQSQLNGSGCFIGQ